MYLLLLAGLKFASCGSASEHTDPLLPQDYQVIFQLAIDHPQLQAFLHADTDTSRRQVIFQTFASANSDKLKGVIKFGKRVALLTESEIRQSHVQNYFVVHDWVCNKNSVHFQLQYPIEGLWINYTFQKSNGKWALADFQLVEK